MSAQINDGGPAFPNSDTQVAHRVGMAACAGLTAGDERDAAYLQAQARVLTGMTLRDWFAGQLPDPFRDVSLAETASGMSGVPCPAQSADSAEWTRFWAEAEAAVRYMKADAMLKAREACK